MIIEEFLKSFVEDTPMKKLLIPHHMPDEALEGVKDQVELVYPDSQETSWDHAALQAKMSGCVAFLAIGHRIDRALLEANPQLKVVGNLGVGYDNIDWKAATELGVCVVNTPQSVIHATAELTIAIMLDALRNIYNYQKQVRDTLTCGSPVFPRGLTTAYGKTLGIVGFGRIGKAVAEKARGLGMKIDYNDTVRAEGEIEERLEASFLPFERLLAESDIITLHCPYTPENHHLIAGPQLAMMKQGSYLVNAARGPLVREADLVAALRSGHLAGAAIDVYEFEPQVGAELAALDHVALTPHVGSSAYDTRVQMAREALSGMIACLKGEKPYNLVNPSVLG